MMFLKDQKTVMKEQKAFMKDQKAALKRPMGYEKNIETKGKTL